MFSISHRFRRTLGIFLAIIFFLTTEGVPFLFAQNQPPLDKTAALQKYLKHELSLEEYQKIINQTAPEAPSTTVPAGLQEGETQPPLPDGQATSQADNPQDNSTESSPSENSPREEVQFTEGPEIEQSPSAFGPEKFGKTDVTLTPKPIKEMSRFERIAWGLARAIIPTLISIVGVAVLGIGTGGIGFILAPMLLAGISSALVNWAYEARMNSAFRETKKSNQRVFRDVLTASIKDAVMAPFTVGMGGVGKIVGEVTAKAIVASVAKTAALTFAGKVVSSAAAGGAKFLLNKYLIKNDQVIASKEAEMKDLLDEFRNSGGADDALLSKFLSLEREVTELRSENYSLKDFRKDSEQALWSAAIGGFLGGTVSNLAASTKIAETLSMKLFQDTTHSLVISKVLTDAPFSFIEGSGNAKIDKIAILREIKALSEKYDTYPDGSAERLILERRIQFLRQQSDQINILKAGAGSMVTGMAINGTILATQYGIYKAASRLQPQLTQEEKLITRGERADSQDIKEYKDKISQQGADPSISEVDGPYKLESIGKREGVTLKVKPNAEADGVSMEDTVILRKGDEKFGWTHISYDRPDGTNHAKEIARAFRLPDSDDSVKKLIMDTVETGAAIPDTARGSINFVKSFGDGRAIKVIVSTSKNQGSIITAYLAGKNDISLAERVGDVDLSSIDFANPSKLNINSAPEVSIDLLRGMSTPAAKAIIDWRKTHGAIPDLATLRSIPGVDGNSIKLFQDFITFK